MKGGRRERLYKLTTRFSDNHGLWLQSGGGGGGVVGVHLGAFVGGGGVWLGSPNPDPICDQNMPFAGTVFPTRPLKFIPIFKARLS